MRRRGKEGEFPGNGLITIIRISKGEEEGRLGPRRNDKREEGESLDRDTAFAGENDVRGGPRFIENRKLKSKYSAPY